MKRRSTYGFCWGDVTFVRLRIEEKDQKAFFDFMQSEKIYAVRSLGSGPVMVDVGKAVGGVSWAGLYTAEDAAKLVAWAKERGYKERRGKGWAP